MSNTLTRADLIDALCREVGLSRNDCSELLEALLEHLAKALERGELVKLARFGNFSVRAKRPRIGRNPKTGVEATISARRVVSFKSSQIMRERVEKS
jgi:integration host factor subunit alpha